MSRSCCRSASTSCAIHAPRCARSSESSRGSMPEIAEDLRRDLGSVVIRSPYEIVIGGQSLPLPDPAVLYQRNPTLFATSPLYVHLQSEIYDRLYPRPAGRPTMGGDLTRLLHPRRRLGDLLRPALLRHPLATRAAHLRARERLAARAGAALHEATPSRSWTRRGSRSRRQLRTLALAPSHAGHLECLDAWR